MSIAGSQQRTLLELLAQLRPHWRRDRNLPARIQNVIARQRSFGARDRRLYRELIYVTLRYLPWIEKALDTDPNRATQLIAWLAADSPVTERFRETFVADWPACPPTVADKTALIANHLGGLIDHKSFGEPPAFGLLPAWFQEHCPDAFAPREVDTLLSRAPLWIRIQTANTAPIVDEFRALTWRWSVSGDLESAWRVEAQVNVTKSRAYESGLVEIQDLGSQLLLRSAQISPGGLWLDACAGAGGKTLQLAALLGPGAEIEAADIRVEALRELASRAARAGLHVEAPAAVAPKLRSSENSNGFARLRILSGEPASVYDGVLVDAPCSGSGTWRRAPHLKWATQPAHIDAAAVKQLELLGRSGNQVRIGGRLIYATCSLSHRENEHVIAGFLAAHPNFSVDPITSPFNGSRSALGVTFLPSQHDSDGFFVSSLRRQS